MNHNPAFEAFLTKLRQSSELQSKVEHLGKQQPLDLPESLAALPVEAGTPVTAEVWQTILAQKPDSNELSDTVLNHVTGGTSFLDLIDRFLTTVVGETSSQAT